MIDDRQRREKNSPLKFGPNLGQTWTGLTANWRSPTWVAHSRGAPTQL